MFNKETKSCDGMSTAAPNVIFFTGKLIIECNKSFLHRCINMWCCKYNSVSILNV